MNEFGKLGDRPSAGSPEDEVVKTVLSFGEFD